MNYQGYLNSFKLKYINSKYILYIQKSLYNISGPDYSN